MRLASVGGNARGLGHSASEEACVVHMSALWPDVEPGANDEADQTNPRKRCSPGNSEQPENDSADDQEREHDPPEAGGASP